jgi:hypothetical protein
MLVRLATGRACTRGVSEESRPDIHYDASQSSHIVLSDLTQHFRALLLPQCFQERREVNPTIEASAKHVDFASDLVPEVDSTLGMTPEEPLDFCCKRSVSAVT